MIFLFHLLHFWWRKIFVEDDFSEHWDPKLYSIGASFYCNNEIVFDPPCYQQRYAAVAAVIEEEIDNTPLRKIVDFGCAELSFFIAVKRFKSVLEVVAVDIDEELLTKFGSKVEPQLSDHLYWRREEPLVVKVCCGSVTDYDPILKDTDVVVAIELIEHLHEETLSKLPNNIFGCIRPRLAIFTTPNAEFNVNFKRFSGMRHWDHKFEWTRKQFENWALSITQSYPDYSVKLFGIGPGPSNTKDVGCCSQMAVFRLQNPECLPNAAQPIISNYKLIREAVYPYYKDIRTREEKIADEVRNRVWDVSRNYNSHLLPLKDFLPFLEEHCQSLEELREILKAAKWIVEGSLEDPLVAVPKDYYSDSDEFDDDDCDDDVITAEPVYDEQTPFTDDWDEQITWDYFQKNNCQESNHVAESEHNWSDERFENCSDSFKMSGDEKMTKKSDFNVPNTCEDSLSESFCTQIDMTNTFPSNGMSKSLIVESESNGKRCKRKTDDQWTEIYDHKKKMVEEANKAGPSRLSKTDEKGDIISDDGSSNSNDGWNQNDPNPDGSAWEIWDRDRIEPLRKNGRLNRLKKTLAKSCSLDSCLENINCERAEVQAMYLSMHSRARTHDISSPGPDSGYPASTSMDLTDQTSGFPASACLDLTSDDSLSGEDDVPVVAPRLPPLPPPPPVENGDVANNNRDGEGNNVEGRRNPLPPPFAPEVAFPPWLLHLLLEPPPRLLPDEGLGGDDSDASDSPGPSIN